MKTDVNLINRVAIQKIFSTHGIHLAFLYEYSLHIPIAFGHQNNIKRTRLNASRSSHRRLSRPLGTTEGNATPAVSRTFDFL
jgi:hypothetical protein